MGITAPIFSIEDFWQITASEGISGVSTREFPDASRIESLDPVRKPIMQLSRSMNQLVVSILRGVSGAQRES